MFSFSTSKPSTTSSGFGSSLFGKTTTSSSLFGSTVPAVATTAASLFGSSSPATSSPFRFSSPSLFGAPAASSTSSLFSSFSAQKPAAAAAAPSLFGSIATTPSQSLLGSAPAASATSTQPTESVNATVARILVEGRVYGDPRDDIIRSFNCLQVLFGRGSIVETAEKSIDIDDSTGDFGAFKSFTYNVRPPRSDQNLNIVSLVFEQKLDNALAHKQDILDALSLLFNMGNAGLVACDGIFPMSETKTVLYFHLAEHDSSGLSSTAKRVPADKIITYMDQVIKSAPTNSTAREQLQKLNLVDYYIKRQWTDDEVETFLALNPPGIPADVWKSATDENPDPKRLIPFPLPGFEAIRERQKMQQLQRGINRSKAEKLKSELNEISRNSLEMLGKANELIEWQKQYEHRIFQIILKMETRRKSGTPLSLEEAKLNNHILDLWKKVHASDNGLRIRLSRIKHLLDSRRFENDVLHNRAIQMYNLNSESQKGADWTANTIQNIQQGLENIVCATRGIKKRLKAIERD